MEETGYTVGRMRPEWGKGGAQSLTFVVTEDCNLRCKINIGGAKNMSRYDSKVRKTPANSPEPRLCFGCRESCFLVSCEGTCSLNCTVSTSSRPPVRKVIK